MLERLYQRLLIVLIGKRTMVMNVTLRNGKIEGHYKGIWRNVMSY